MRKVEALVQDISQKVLKGDGFYIASLILDWPKVVGKTLSTISTPEKITFPIQRSFENPIPGTLTIMALSSAHAFELSHQQELLKEKINRFFGRKMVEKIVFRHGGITLNGVKNSSPEKISKGCQIPADTLKAVNHVQDVELQQALLSLARHLV